MYFLMITYNFFHGCNCSLDIEYFSLQGNDPFEYKKELNVARNSALKNSSPILVEVSLTTLGYWYLKNKTHPDGKFVNYHAGPAPKVFNFKTKKYNEIVSSDEDPLHVLSKYLETDELIEISRAVVKELERELI